MGTTYSELTFAGLIGNRALSDPGLDVLTIEGGGQRPDEVRTYQQLWDNGRRLAAGLREQGLKQGELFGLLMANHAEFVETMVAAGITGTVFVPIDPRTKGDKLTYMLKAANCVGVIAADYALPHLAEIRDELPQLKWVVGLSTDEGRSTAAQLRAHGVVPYAQVADTPAEGIELAEVAPESAMQLIYTSGTTGDPKGIVMTHKRYCETAALCPRLFGYRSDDRPYTGLSLTHANAQAITLGASLAAGMRCVLSRRFTKSRLWDITRRYGCTSFNLLGGMTTAVYAEAPREDDADNPVRFVVSAGMPKAIWSDFERRFNLQILEFYGAAEGGLTVKAIAECPDVDDVHVYGVPAASGVPGEKDPVAAVVPKDHASFDAQAVFRACRQRLEANFVPRFIQVLEQIPKTASEKPQERFLIEAFETQPDSVFAERRA